MWWGGPWTQVLPLIALTNISVQAIVVSHLENFNILLAGVSAFTSNPSPGRKRCLLNTNQVCQVLAESPCMVCGYTWGNRMWSARLCMKWGPFLFLASLCALSPLLARFQSHDLLVVLKKGQELTPSNPYSMFSLILPSIMRPLWPLPSSHDRSVLVLHLAIITLLLF